MQFPKNLDLKPINILKIAGLVLIAIIVIAFILRLILPSFSLLLPKTNNRLSLGQNSLISDFGFAGENMETSYDKAMSSVGLSVRNITPTPAPDDGIIIGDDAEEFEVTDYSANIETRRLQDTCGKIADLKPREDVIFENANEYERSCSYTFKVKHESVEEILVVIEDLDPKELNENIYTIKRLVDDYTSEVDILETKMKSIEETLASAISAYDDITDLATKTQDVESLAKIIDSKITIIERLTQQKININAQLERLSRSKAEQLDRLEYTYFNVYIAENKFVDIDNLKDSWKNEIKQFVRDINSIIQDITINLISSLFLILQYIIYIIIILVIAKYGWKYGKKFWQK